MTKKNRVATAVRYDSDRMFRQLQEARAERDRASTVSGSWPVLARIATSLGHLDDAASHKVPVGSNPTPSAITKGADESAPFSELGRRLSENHYTIAASSSLLTPTG